MFKGVIYQATNIQNNKSYIGKTTQDFDLYKRQHIVNSKTDERYFYRGIRKYGAKNFKWIILGEIESISVDNLNKELSEAEIECIYFFRTFGSDGKKVDNIYGYNLTLGGDGTKGRISSQEERLKNSEWHTGRVGKLCPNSKEIYQYDLQGNFICKYSAVAEATRITGINNIGSCVIGKQKTAGKYYWTYENLGRKGEIKISYSYFDHSRKVGKFDINNNLIKSYDSIQEAKKENQGDIDNSLKKGCITNYNNYWKYL